jgi:cell division septation protein DedD
VQGSLSEIRKDVTELQTAVGERVANEKVVHTRLSALEDRVTTIDGPQGGETGEKVAQKPGEPPAAASGAEPGAAKAEGPTPTTTRPVFVPIETGSIPPKEDAKEEIVFGEAVVTRGGREFAVQLGAAPSLTALKQSWGQLAERHAGALANLKPRVVSPRGEGGIYRLIAGPLPTKADAERVCSELRVGPKACFATPYAGAPL